MVVDVLAAPLLRVELFQGLKSQQLSQIARAAERIVFRAGERITTTGEDADAALLIVGGAAEWQDLPGADAEEIEIGSMIGEMAMFVEHTYGATVVAKTQVRCLKLTRTALCELLVRDTALADHLASKVTARLRRVAEELRAIDTTILDGVLPLRADAAPSAPALPH